jgi:bifunctional non-homologous end joining protein LigD
VQYEPQKALLADRPPTGSRWIHEIKLDGFRMGLFVNRGSTTIISRRGTSYTSEFPEIAAAARKLKVREAVLDGEIVVLDKHGVSRFQLLQQLGSNRAGLTYFAFDLLSLDGRDLRKEPLEERKRLLKKVIGRGSGLIRYTSHVEGEGAKVFEQACALGAEGIISKLRDGPYRTGARSSDWQKIKCVRRQEFVVGGFTDPSGSRVGVGSILIGYYEGSSLRFAGKVGTGTGWSDSFGAQLRRRMEKSEIDRTPFDPPPPGWLGKNAHWVRPTLVAEVEFSEWTSDGRARHPSLKGFREDKPARDVVREVETKAGAREQTKKLYPRLGITSQDLAELYGEIAKWVLPHVQNRPLTLVKATAPITKADALRSQARFIHHTPRDQSFVPDTVPRIKIEEKKKTGEYCYIDSAESLVTLFDVGVVELHTWNALVSDVEAPDRVVFDIDPGDGVAWRDVVAAARRLRAILKRKKLESWVKTTGGKGLHVVMPFRPEHEWDEVFEFSRAVGEEMAKESSKYIVAFDRSERRGKILIDYKRNYRTSIAVAAFSPRATPSGAVSVPVSWEGLGTLKSAELFTVENIRDRLKRLRADPWKGYWSTRQRLTL